MGWSEAEERRLLLSLLAASGGERGERPPKVRESRSVDLGGRKKRGGILRKKREEERGEQQREREEIFWPLSTLRDWEGKVSEKVAVFRTDDAKGSTQLC